MSAEEISIRNRFNILSRIIERAVQRAVRVLCVLCVLARRAVVVYVVYLVQQYMRKPETFD